MTTFESAVKTITSTEETVFGTLSDLRNLEKSKHLLPANTIQDLEFHENRCLFSVNPIGKIGLSIVEREPSKMIKFGSDDAPIDFNLWIHLNETTANDTQMQVKVQADIPPMVKMMFGGRMQQFVDQFADAIAGIKYA
jgi:carbon monoxide dehydrogenase subunit G